MVTEPELFFKSQALLQQEHQSKKLKQGPEGQWKTILNNISGLIKEAKKLVPYIFYFNQTAHEIDSALNLFNKVTVNFSHVNDAIMSHRNDG